MHTMVSRQSFLTVETERTGLLDICECFHSKTLLKVEDHNFILWKNEGEYAIITKAQIKEARRVREELERAPEDHLSTAGFPCIFWDDCHTIAGEYADMLLGKEHQLYREAEKPEDGSDGRS
ncbi:MAG: hypothetical protein FVQ80_11340 [Planctomycetes bacterium]|nr:hypothetical protein [Planctomycetota bacterium]